MKDAFRVVEAEEVGRRIRAVASTPAEKSTKAGPDVRSRIIRGADGQVAVYWFGDEKEPGGSSSRYASIAIDEGTTLLALHSDGASPDIREVRDLGVALEEIAAHLGRPLPPAPARLDPTGTAAPRKHLSAPDTGSPHLVATEHVDRETGTRTPLATGRPHTYWHGSPCSCSWGADHGNGSPEQSEFAQRGPAPWVLACVRALEAAPGSAHVFRAALSLVPADVLAAAREETT